MYYNGSKITYVFQNMSVFMEKKIIKSEKKKKEERKLKHLQGC